MRLTSDSYSKRKVAFYSRDIKIYRVHKYGALFYCIIIPKALMLDS